MKRTLRTRDMFLHRAQPQNGLRRVLSDDVILGTKLWSPRRRPALSSRKR